MIKNHQEVSLVFNEPFFAALSIDPSTDVGLHELYLAIRNEIFSNNSAFVIASTFKPATSIFEERLFIKYYSPNNC